MQNRSHSIRGHDAISYVEQHGTELEKARLHYILYGTRPSSEVVYSLHRVQNSDGGFPLGMLQDNPSTVDSTLTALWQMDELGMLESLSVSQAVSFLLVSQKDDGGWDEDPDITKYDLPPWINPGDLKTRIYLTAYSAYWLACRGYQSQTAFKRALVFLRKHQNEAGKIFGYAHSTWIAVSVFLMAGDPYSDIARKCLQYLLNKPLSSWVDSQLAWALDCLGKAGIPKEHPFIQGALAELLRRQSAEGSWLSEDGEKHTAVATLEVLKVMKCYGEV